MKEKEKWKKNGTEEYKLVPNSRKKGKLPLHWDFLKLKGLIPHLGRDDRKSFFLPLLDVPHSCFLVM